MDEAESEAIFQELAGVSWERFHKSYYNDRVDDVLLGALIASLVGSGYALIGLNSDGENHHLRLERDAERLILRLTHLSGDLTVSQTQGRHASVIIGYGERTPDLSKVWGSFQAEVKSLYSPAWEPGIISFDADLAAQFVYAQISLLMDLDRYIGDDFTVDLKLFGSHVEALVDCLRRYLRGRLGRTTEGPPSCPSTAGPGALPRSLAHQRELLESRQEILMGEIICTMAEAGFPVIGIVTDVDCRRIRFRAKPDPVLNALLVEIQPQSLLLQGEIKNYLAHTGQLLQLNEQLKQLPAGVSYRMNSVFALRDHVALPPGDPGSKAWRDVLQTVLLENVTQLRDTLSPFKKGYSPFSQMARKEPTASA